MKTLSWNKSPRSIVSISRSSSTHTKSPAETVTVSSELAYGIAKKAKYEQRQG